jgi:serine/threonine-protein kinase
MSRVIGRGALSLVFAAEHLVTGRPVALKTLSPDADSALNRRRFQREIRILAYLRHANIIALQAARSQGQLPYHVTGLVDGGSLRHQLEATGALRLCDALRIAIEIAGALDHTHRRRIVHRDVKPDNILLGHRAVLADFGIACSVGANSSNRTTNTDHGTPGTLLYMSPEQLAGAALDGRSDVYSLGLVLYEMLAGELPFQKNNTLAAFTWRYTAPAPSLRGAGVNVPATVDLVIRRALQREPADRFATSREFAAALTHAQQLAA